MEHSAEQKLIRDAQSGSREAFTELVNGYWERVLRWLYAMTGNVHTAEDLAQDVFVKAWVGLPRLKEEATFRSWLFRIGQNCYRDHRRRQRDKPAQELTMELSADEQLPLAQLIETEGQNLLEKALALLPSHYRSAYLLWTQEELPYADIAQVLDITEETARWRVSKTRQLLVKQLKKYLETAEE